MVLILPRKTVTSFGRGSPVQRLGVKPQLEEGRVLATLAPVGHRPSQLLVLTIWKPKAR